MKIASWFIVTIMFTSLVSRVLRSTELRIQAVEPDETALRFIRERRRRPFGSSPTGPTPGCREEYEHKLRDARESHHLPATDRVLFLEVRPGDASEFGSQLQVHGVDVDGHHVLRSASPAIPNAIAALLLYIRDETGKIPHAYFGWTEGNPIAYLLKFLAFGEGDTAPVTREVLRQTTGSAQAASDTRGVRSHQFSGSRFPVPCSRFEVRSFPGSRRSNAGTENHGN